MAVLPTRPLNCALLSAAPMRRPAARPGRPGPRAAPRPAGGAKPRTPVSIARKSDRWSAPSHVKVGRGLSSTARALPPQRADSLEAAVEKEVSGSAMSDAFREIRESLRSERARQVQNATEVARGKVAADILGKNQGHLWFSLPEVPVAGAHFTLYVDKNSSEALCGRQELTLLMGFNQWTMREHAVTTEMAPAGLPSDHGADWWMAEVEVPSLATEANFVFKASGDSWENNGQRDFSHKVLGGPLHDGGKVHLHEVDGPDPNEKLTLRVWTPPGFKAENAPSGGYPVVYLNDGQNLFDDQLAFGGMSWRAGFAATYLISTGELPPFVIVGIDNRGVNRGLDYTPYPCGAGREGFRQDAANWPGGGVWEYLAWVMANVLPFAEDVYKCSPSPSLRAFGGSSLGGICGLCCAMKYPEEFGGILAESPSFWIKEGQFLEDMRDYAGPWPQRVFMAMGTKEYSGTRPAKRPECDEWMADSAEEGKAILEAKGLKDGVGLMYQLEKGAAHNEADWARRLPAALKFLVDT